MREKFIDRNFNANTQTIIGKANEIIASYQDQGFTLTLRQLYYQFVSRDLIPNKQSEYKRLGSIINDGRLAGLIDWDAIEDRTRNLQTPAMWDTPSSVLEAVAEQYKENPWDTQDVYIEVWIEKDALLGVIEPVCDRWRVSYLGCRGYTSQSEIYSAGKRLKAMRRKRDVRPIVLYLGDHDPSGIDMDRSNADRTIMFGRQFFEFRRLALNMSQIEEHNPPPNPAKETDARFAKYQEQHGDESWELDALEPSILDTLIDKEIASFVDMGEWDAALRQEQDNKDALTDLGDNWEDVKRFLSDMER